jgi:hypothetical protein
MMMGDDPLAFLLLKDVRGNDPAAQMVSTAL